MHGKGDKDRIVYFSVKCKLYLQEYIKEREGTSEYLFLSERKPYNPLTKSGVEKIFKRIASRTDVISSVSPHKFRHSYATQANSKGMDVTVLSKLLGHSCINTTMVYTKVNQNRLKVNYEQYIS